MEKYLKTIAVAVVTTTISMAIINRVDFLRELAGGNH
jgi:hypothetical protein